MNKYIIGIDGVRCPMCEAHVKDAAMRTIRAKKVQASYRKNELIVITESEFSQQDFEAIFAPTGYRVTTLNKQEATKTFFGWK